MRYTRSRKMDSFRSAMDGPCRLWFDGDGGLDSIIVRKLRNFAPRLGNFIAHRDARGSEATRGTAARSLKTIVIATAFAHCFVREVFLPCRP